MPILTRTTHVLHDSGFEPLPYSSWRWPSLVPARGDAPQSASKAKATGSVKATTKENQASGSKPVSFMGDVAPILVRNCIACHNPKKSESKYVMTSFTQLAKGASRARVSRLCPANPRTVISSTCSSPTREPRMPYKLDPLPQDEIKLLETWVAEGAKYDGTSPTEDWTFLLRKTQVVTIPRGLSRDGADHGPGVQPRRPADRSVGLS